MRAQQPLARNKQHAAQHLGIIITNENNYSFIVRSADGPQRENALSFSRHIRQAQLRHSKR
jgi:hypothetical protein